MNIHEKYVTVMRSVATGLFLYQQVYICSMTVGSGVTTGLVIYAIWSPWFGGKNAGI